MLYTGMTSVTFRKLSAGEVIAVAAKAGLQCIEWGGDVHMPPGGTAAAKQLGEATREAGLFVSSYGSYWRGEDIASFRPVIATAEALSAPVVRVWAGKSGSASGEPEYRRLLGVLRGAAELAGERGVTVAMEYHSGTFTDTLEGAMRLLRDAESSGLAAYWQPPVGSEPERNLDDIRALAPYLSNIHVFSWDKTGTRLPLEAHEEDWQKYLSLAESLDGSRCALLEFTAGDDPGQFMRDAARLTKWISLNGEKCEKI